MYTDLTACRPLPFYFLNSSDLENGYTEKIIDLKMKELYDDGFGGCILFNSASSGFASEVFLTETYFEIIERFVKAAGKYGLKLYLMDGWRCPSGDVGGKIAAIAPNLHQQRLTIDGNGQVKAVNVPWGFPAFEEPESSRLFIELVYEKFAARLGKYFGNIIEGIFSDADNRRYDAFSQEIMGAEDYYPWAQNFAENFAAEYGYDLTPYLHDIVSGKSSKYSYDYWCFCEKLYLQWFENNHKWCQAHNLKYSFHTSDTGPFPRSRCQRSSIFIEGNPFHLYRHCDLPGTDHELLLLDGGTHFDDRRHYLKVSRGGDDKFYQYPDFFRTKYDLRAKYVSSAAIHHGKSGGACELFAVTNWGATANDLRLIAVWQLFSGITTFIPHAIEHKHECRRKYIAPPEQHLGLAGAIRQLNDFIAENVFIASRGEFAPSVLVEDVSEAVRAGVDDTENFFTFTDMLTHAGISYLIVPEGTPGAIKTLGRLPQLPEKDFTFTGGELIGMRRKLDGQHFLLVSNIWSREELSGTLEFENRKIDLLIAPGEIAVINGPFERFRSPQKVKSVSLPFPAEVGFAAPNRVPFHYNSEFTITRDIPGKVQLLIPEVFAGDTILFDGKKLTGGAEVLELTDRYLAFDIPAAAGKHSFELSAWHHRPAYLGRPHVGTGNEPEVTGDYQFYLPVILQGDFDTALEISGEFDHQVGGTYYILELYAPEKCDVSISPRRNTLDAGSWADQGQIFYSGTASYRFDISSYSGNATFSAPGAVAHIEVWVDGKFCGKTAFAPFQVALGDISNSRELVVKVTNTSANEYEEFRAPSGLTGGAELLIEL